MKKYTDCILVKYMNVKQLKWAGHVVRMYDNRMPYRTLEGCLRRRRRPAAKQRNGSEDEMWTDAAKLLNKRKMCSRKTQD
jgi:hypothetical protein